MQEEDVPKYSGKVPNLMTKGDVGSMALYAGMGSGRITEILPAAAVVNGIIEDAKVIIDSRLRNLVESRPTFLPTIGTMV